MSKRLFEVLDIMNQNDTKNNTQTVIIGNHFVSANYNRQGTTVSIGIGDNHVFDIESGKKVAMLVLVDIEEYNKLKEQ
jgi:hypothetical protein